MNAPHAKKSRHRARSRLCLGAAIAASLLASAIYSPVQAQQSQRDAEIFKKMQAIKKKADDAWAEKKRARETQPTVEVPGAFVATEANAKQADAANEAARLKAEQEKIEREKAAREIAEKKEAEQQKAKLEAERLEAEREKAEQEAAVKLRAAEAAEQKREADQQKALEEKRVADANRAAEQRRLDEQRRLQDEQRRRLESERAKARQQREDAGRKADERRESEKSRGEKLQKDLEKQRNRATNPNQAETNPNRALDAEKRRQFEEARRNDWQRAAQVSGRDANGPANDNASRRAKAEELSNRLRAARDSRSGLGRGDTDNKTSIVENDRSVTILLIMDIGKKGVRRWSKTADPMVCLKDKCYLSNGPKKPSREIMRSTAFGPGIALGTRGLACRSSPTCVFRHVDLHGRSASLQPVDLKFIRHDRRPKRRIAADETCNVVSGRLTCNKLFGAGDWRAWVIPENVAENAGPKLLRAALENGLR